MENTDFATLHPREVRGSGRFRERIHAEPQAILAPDLVLRAHRIFPDAEGVEITGAGVGKDGAYLHVEMDDRRYTITAGDEEIEVTDEFGEETPAGHVLNALTGDDPGSVPDAMAEFAESAGCPASSIFGSQLETDAKDCGYTLTFDESTGTASAYGTVRKYSAAVHLSPDGTVTRTVNGHEVPEFGITYGRASNLDSWAGQNAGRIRSAQLAALGSDPNHLGAGQGT